MEADCQQPIRLARRKGPHWLLGYASRPIITRLSIRHLDGWRWRTDALAAARAWTASRAYADA